MRGYKELQHIIDLLQEAFNVHVRSKITCIHLYPVCSVPSYIRAVVFTFGWLVVGAAQSRAVDVDQDFPCGTVPTTVQLVDTEIDTCV